MKGPDLKQYWGQTCHVHVSTPKYTLFRIGGQILKNRKSGQKYENFTVNVLYTMTIENKRKQNDFIGFCVSAICIRRRFVSLQYRPSVHPPVITSEHRRISLSIGTHTARTVKSNLCGAGRRVRRLNCIFIQNLAMSFIVSLTPNQH